MMKKLFNPQSIAVIGASRHEDKLGYQILKNIIDAGFTGKIFPVNPEAEEILSKKCFPTVIEISDQVDLAIIVVPKEIVPEILRQCVKKIVPYVVIITAGFAEKGLEGQKLQDEVKKIITNSQTRILGPNCLGLFNTENNLNATFAKQGLVKGNVSAVFQSGALGVAALDWAKQYGFGFSKFISLGNKMDLEESDMLEYLTNDPETRVIALYLEQIANPTKFLEIARNTAKEKPVIVLKGGTTSAGAEAAFSHTAAMVTPNKINEAIFSQANLINARTIDEMLNLIPILSYESPAKGKNLAIVTNAGGPGILATDAAIRAGLNLNKVLDLTGTALASDYKKALDEFIKSPTFDSILVILTPQSMTEVVETAKVVASFSKKSKPVIVSFMGNESVKEGIEIFKKESVPFFSEPQDAVKALAKAIKYWEKRETYAREIRKVKSEKLTLTDNPFDLISRYKIKVAESKLISDFSEAKLAAQKISYPVAVKNMAEGAHKYKSGKLVLNVTTDESLKKALVKVGLPAIVQKMIDSPFEVIVGGKFEKNIGHVLTFGWGGILTQDLNDLSMRVISSEVNLTELDLDEMIKETRIGKVLMREKLDLEPIKDVLRKIVQLLSDFPEIVELDLNPLKIKEGQAICIDVRYKIGNKDN